MKRLTIKNEAHRSSIFMSRSSRMCVEISFSVFVLVTSLGILRIRFGFYRASNFHGFNSSLTAMFVDNGAHTLY